MITKSAKYFFKHVFLFGQLNIFLRYRVLDDTRQWPTKAPQLSHRIDFYLYKSDVSPQQRALPGKLQCFSSKGSRT